MGRAFGGDGWSDPRRRAVTKVATQGVGAFAAQARALGWVDDGGVHLPTARVPEVPFAARLPEQWPQVPILYGCVEPELLLLSACLNAGVPDWCSQARVLASCGGRCRVGVVGWTSATDAAGQPLRSGPAHPVTTIPDLGCFRRQLNPQKARCCVAGADRRCRPHWARQLALLCLEQSLS